jgi:hypothetical protein
MAERVAAAAHDGQFDKSGVPYITHPQRVASSLVGDTLAHATAWLHDVIEDTPITAEDLLVRGIPVEVVAAIEAVTKRPREQPDDDYSRIRTNPLALKVKLADIGDNSAQFGSHSSIRTLRTGCDPSTPTPPRPFVLRKSTTPTSGLT